MRILGAIGVTMGESCTTFKVNGAIYPKARQVPLTEITMAKLLSIFHCLLGKKKNAESLILVSVTFVGYLTQCRKQIEYLKEFLRIQE